MLGQVGRLLVKPGPSLVPDGPVPELDPAVDTGDDVIDLADGAPVPGGLDDDPTRRVRHHPPGPREKVAPTLIHNCPTSVAIVGSTDGWYNAG